MRILGAEVRFANGEQPPAFLVRLGGTLIEIYPADSRRPETSDNKLAGWRHLALRVDSIETARDELARCGVTFTDPIKPAGAVAACCSSPTPRATCCTSSSAPPAQCTELCSLAFSLLQMSPSAIIFDMDGVIVNSEPLHERAFHRVFAEIGYAGNHGVDFPAYYGSSDVHVWRDFIARHQPPHTLDELLGRKERHFAGFIAAEEPIFEGLPELLERCAARWPIGLASGSRHATINSVLALRGLRRHFRAIVSSEDVARGKPAPDIFLRTAELLGIAPAECVVIEDSAAGVTAGRAAGMSVIAITNSLPAEKLAHATHVVSDYSAIEKLLRP
ncbi:MAG: HAD-IA family hydrolase [Rhodobacteraceae bacterium]|nr:HAD-IA family hydrolase [Paracoccaceae bacterium]